MKIRNMLVLAVLFAFVTSCGPVIGQLMRMSEGIKDFNVSAGKLSDLKKGQNLLVVGPFDKTDKAFYIARGDEAAAFPVEFEKTGFFKAESYIGNKYKDISEMTSAIRSKSAADLKRDLGLKRQPDVIMFGTILERETIVAPTRGIIMSVGYRLEFFNLKTKSSTIVEVSVKDHFSKCIARVAQEIVAKASM